MLERARSYWDNILSEDFSTLQDNHFTALEHKRSLRIRLKNSDILREGNEKLLKSKLQDGTMTRKTRTRRPRIAVIQSGYCAVCNIPYNNVEDHIQSKKHQKLIGEDANYIALNGSLNGFLQSNNIPFLNLNGIDAIGVHDNSLDEFSTKYRRRTMPKTRATSACDQVNPSPLSPTGSEIGHHHLRSRRYVNYMTPPLEDDSLQESLDINLTSEESISHPVFKEYRELRSSTRALAKLTEPPVHHDETDDVWNSGRPKRSCIRTKRLSLNDNTNSNCKTYYKVEVMTNKIKSGSNESDKNKRLRSHSPKCENERKDGLIVKFKKLRNSELIQLNNEATNFLFPKKSDSDAENSEDEGYKRESASNRNIFEYSAADSEKESQCNIKIEDNVSIKSNSNHKTKKKRRTHAEAFILDNQKYYKFETPSSRLRFQGSYLPPVVKPFKINGELSPTQQDGMEDVKDHKVEISHADRFINKFEFCFEKIPKCNAWYKTFQRVDRGEQVYRFFSDYFWDPYVLPYQMAKITPIDPKTCMMEYLQCLKALKEPISNENSVCTSPEPSTSVSSPINEHDIFEVDEDSKLSAITLSSTCSNEETFRNKAVSIKTVSHTSGCGKNPRKSPRQHASTLAILSSLLYQRKRKLKNKTQEESLPTILEEDLQPNISIKQEEPNGDIMCTRTEDLSFRKKLNQVKTEKYYWRFKSRINYQAIAENIDNELNNVSENSSCLFIGAEDDHIDFHNSRTNTREILRLFEESKAKETDTSCRRFFNGTPGRKPGRKRKKNLTGWPNKNKRVTKREQSKEKDVSSENGVIDSTRRVETDVAEIVRQNDNVVKVNDSDSIKVVSEMNCKDNDEINTNIKTLNKKTRTDVRQPYVYVQKLDNKLIDSQIYPSRRTVRKQKRVPISPKSPRILRKPRGRWYKER